MAYAENTTVDVEKSIGELRALLRKNGADRIAHFEEPTRLAVQFFLKDRMVRVSVLLPDWKTIPSHNAQFKSRTDAQRQGIAQQKHRQRARALLLVVKAKLESVESGVETFEEAFLANVVMADGKTVGEHTLPVIADSYATGRMPAMLLPALEGPK